jgi:hypothetical protein
MILSTPPESPPAGSPACPGRGTVGQLKVHKPALEERLRHGFQRLVHAAVQLYLVIQRAQDVGDGALFGEGRELN